MTLHQAAIIHAYAWKSDPFAYQRAMHSMRRGDILQSDLLEDAFNLLHARSNDEARRAKQLAGV